jgi:hypothetical protein
VVFGLGLLACAALASFAVADLLRAAARIHGFHDLDNEAGLSTWTFHFDTIRGLAIGIGVFLVLSALVLVDRHWRGRQRLSQLPIMLLSAALVLGLTVCVVHGLDRAETMSAAEDPLTWMRGCAIALCAEGLIALVLSAAMAAPTAHD